MGFQQRTDSDELPNRLVVRGCAMACDGGTIHLDATDDAGFQVSILLATPLPSFRVSGRLYFNGALVPIRSEREARIIALLSEATVKTSGPVASNLNPQMLIASSDLKDFLERTPEENCRASIRTILRAVQSETYPRLATSEERALAKDLADEANRDNWERPSGKKKRRSWRRGR